ncbi:TetR/AcrR family transcriptional regulator [Paenibacillus oralis]|uniref:TetR/AcrR family transcriptional regulator n=1 Tax=Paenibacillus oralis TaxID=2490856 RepID=A0A3P3U6Z1_9BACL|nr:TetR/AcrR family transcriptional regulator [Paenibacillus oralis]RRJ66137.1 TetR/AcrR family transcriptional regulator [Paenibacillus oralis]
MDRRIAKTRQAIMEAFVMLMGEKSFEKITIQEIADRADVNRGTVYLHFTDKYDLLDQCIETYLQLLYETCLPGGDPDEVSAKALLLRTFEFLQRHASIYSTLMTSKGVPVFRNRMKSMMEQGIEEIIKNCGIGPGISPEILVQFLAVAVAGLMEWWMVQSMPYTPEEMVEQLLLILERNLILPEQVDGFKPKV